METLKKYKMTILGLLIFAVVAYIYVVYFADDVTPGLYSTNSGAGETTIDEELLSLLLSLKSIKLDSSFLSDPAFSSLEDFSRTLNDESVGRPNPFSPLDVSASRNVR